tara:strand:- start:349 stop:723 length:375 start_codon:yes stop_codon:yes gene_type:complete
VKKMSENNTTIADCVADCVEAASSSIFDDIEMVLVAGGALLGLASWGYMKYKSMMADGKITLDELMDAAKEGKDKLEEAEEHIEVLEKVYSEYKVAELKTMLKEKGLSTSGVKAELIARLEAHE